MHADISPSEDGEKVLAAARNILGDCHYQVDLGPDTLVLRSADRACLQKMHDQFRDRRVRDAVRRLLLRNLEGETIRILFNRQAAFMGIIAVVSSGEESPLGPVVLEVNCGDPQELIDWLTSHPTAESRPQGRLSQQRYP